MLDLDSGTVFRNPALVLSKLSHAEKIEWITKNGVDLNTTHFGTHQRVLVTANTNMLKLVKVSNYEWIKRNAGAVDKALQRAESGLEIRRHKTMMSYLLPEDAQPPVTFAFQTANGGRGLMQITDFLTTPDGLKLRYILVDRDTSHVIPNKWPAGTIPAAPPIVKAAPGQYRVVLSNDVTVEIMAVGRTQSGAATHGVNTWWKPDGSPIESLAGYRIECDRDSRMAGIKELFSLVVRCTAPDDVILHSRSFVIEPLPSKTGYAKLIHDGKHIPGYKVVTFAYTDPFRGVPKAVICRWKYAAGNPMSTVVLDGNGTIIKKEGSALPIVFQEPKRRGQNLLIEMDGLGDHWENFEVASWAYLHSRSSRQGYTFGYHSPQHEKSVTFSALKPSQVKEYRIMFTQFHWAEFRDVTLKPIASRTNTLHIVRMSSPYIL